MRMHYTWIAGDINFLPWTCSGPRARQGGRAAGRQGHPVYNIQPVRGPGRGGSAGRTSRAYTYTETDTTGQAEVAERWEGRKEGGGGDSTGCFVLTRPTTCELSTYFRERAPVILTSGAARRVGAAKRGKNSGGRESRDKSVADGGVAGERGDFAPARRVTATVDVKGLPRGERANGVGNHWTFCQRCLIFRKSFARTPLEEER